MPPAAAAAELARCRTGSKDAGKAACAAEPPPSPLPPRPRGAGLSMVRDKKLGGCGDEPAAAPRSFMGGMAPWDSAPPCSREDACCPASLPPPLPRAVESPSPTVRKEVRRLAVREDAERPRGTCSGERQGAAGAEVPGSAAEEEAEEEPVEAARRMEVGADGGGASPWAASAEAVRRRGLLGLSGVGETGKSRAERV